MTASASHYFIAIYGALDAAVSQAVWGISGQRTAYWPALTMPFETVNEQHPARTIIAFSIANKMETTGIIGIMQGLYGDYRVYIGVI